MVGSGFMQAIGSGGASLRYRKDAEGMIDPVVPRLMSTPERACSLETYRAKGRSGFTPGPFYNRESPGSRFVVQLHAARSRHYDLRLEYGEYG